MSSLPFTLRQLEVFASLCASGSFGRSAIDMGISQASISSQIRSLEDQLGFTLFLRKPGKRSILTPEGTDFLKDLHEFERAAKALAAHRRQERSNIESISYKVRVGQGLFDQFIRPHLGAFLSAYPHIDLEFEPSSPTYRLGKDTLSGRLDFAMIHTTSEQNLPPELQVLASVRGGIYGHRDFVGARALPLSPEYISSLPFILPPAGSVQGNEVLSILERNHITAHKIVCHTAYFDVMGTLLQNGVGVASFSDVILPASMRQDVINLQPLANWHLVWFRKDPTPDPRADAVQDFLFTSVLDNADYPKMPE